jgi:transposase InsO family protein
VIIDLFSRKVIGWAMMDSMKTGLVKAALVMAVRQRGGVLPDGLLLHSDRGVQ